MIHNILKSNKIAHFEIISIFGMSGGTGVVIIREYFIDYFQVSDHLEQFRGVKFIILKDGGTPLPPSPWKIP